MQTGSLQTLTINIIVFRDVCRSALEDTLKADKICRIHPCVDLELRHVGLQHSVRLKAWDA